MNDYSSAIRFLVLSHCIDEAFDLAKKHGKMQLYGETLLNSLTTDEIRPQDFSSLGYYFEKEGHYLLAGKYFYHAKEYNKVSCARILESITTRLYKQVVSGTN